ncbi:MAG: histidine kinase [Chitinophagaceae bacterium]
MLYKKKILIGFFSGLTCITSVFSQYKFEKPVVIGKELGFRYNDVRSIKKGKDGFMWMGTSEGLCRFDGQHVKIFRLTENFNKAPFDNSVLAVLPVDNEIWMGTRQGLSVMNSKDNTFRHYQFAEIGKADSLARKTNQQVSVLYRDKAGKVWIGTKGKGVCLYDKARDNFRFFSIERKDFPPLFPSLDADNAILSIEASPNNDSIIWAGTPGGLQEINQYTGRVRLYTFPQKNKDYQVALNAFRRLYHHDDSLLYVGSWAAGVNVFDPVKANYTPLPVKSENAKKILNSPIESIYRKSDHEIWISSIAGMVVYDSKIKDISWYKFNNSVENEFYAVDYIDEANRVWHTDINGLQYFDPLMQQFSRYSFKDLSGPDWVFAFYILSDKTGNNITVCPRMTDGIYHFDRQKEKWTKSLFPHNKSFKSEKDAIRGFVELPSGDFIISADRGMFIYSEKAKQVTLLRDQLPFSLTRRGEILLDHSKNLWIADDELGLIKWKPGTSHYKIYKTREPSNDSLPVTARLANLLEDSRGNIWFKRPGGFGIYLAAKDTIQNFLYATNDKISFPVVNYFAEDRKGRIWISGEGGWIGYALNDNPEKGIVHKENWRNKGQAAYLPGLATDIHGDVWGYTSKDLFKINTDDLSVTTYSFSYGIDEVDYFHFSFLPSGEIIFGGRNDIIIANPSELKRNTEIPVPYIDNLEVMNRPFAFTNSISSLNLNHTQNFFTIGFSAQAYTMTRELRFRYRLKGFDDWTETSNTRLANYTNIPPGDYVFQLQAANNEGVWNKKMMELPVHIATPWWQTLWFRIIAIAAIAFLAWCLYRYRVSQVRKKEQIRSQYEKKLANVEMSALLAQMNPHFLFNSLNSIDSYIIKNESKKASEYLNNFARLMRLILQNSRSNYISLKDELESLDLYLQMESLRFASRFDYEIKMSTDIDSSSILIPPMLIQPYIENAIWHGLMHKKDGRPGKVELIISKREESLLCAIEDNGIGREKATALRSQKTGNHKRSMGMQITQDRIEMINKLYSTNTTIKIIDLHDEEGNASGTRVELVIPV